MEDNLGHIVYSKNVLEFVTVAGEYTNLIENVAETDKIVFLYKTQKILPLLYLKGSLIPELENVYDEIIEKFVTEETWNYYEIALRNKLGKHNDYLEVFDPNISISDTPISSCISENLSDIYQDIKDFITAYRIGTVEIMNDALWECRQNFEQYWGQKILNSLRAIHAIIYNKSDDFDQNEHDNNDEMNNRDTSNWIFTRMQQFKKGHDEE